MTHASEPRSATSRWAYRIATATCLVLVCAGLAAAQIRIPFINRGGDDDDSALVSTMISRLGKTVPVATQEQIALRFRGGERTAPLGAVWVSSQDLPHIDDARKTLKLLLDTYSAIAAENGQDWARPKFEELPFRVQQTGEIDCRVAPVTDDQTPKIRLSSLDARNQKNVNVRIDAPDVKDAAAPVEPGARQLEISCTLGLLGQTDKRDTVAFVLAHELSHILLGHWEREEAVARNQQRVASLTSAAAMGALLVKSNVSVTNNRVNVAATPEASKNAAYVLAAGLALTEFNEVIVSPAWSRQQERDADLLALDIIARTPWKRDGFGDFLNTLENQEKERRKQSQQTTQMLMQSSATEMFACQVERTCTTQSMLQGQALKWGVTLYDRWRDGRQHHMHDNAKKRGDMIRTYLGSGAQGPAALDAQEAENLAKAGVGADASPAGPVVSVAVARQGESAEAVLLRYGMRGDPWREKPVSLFSREQADAHSVQQAVTLRACENVRGIATALEALPQRIRASSAALAGWRMCVDEDPRHVRARAHAEASIVGADVDPRWFLQAATIQQLAGDNAAALRTIARAEREAPPARQYLLLRLQAMTGAGDRVGALARAKKCATEEEPDLGARCMALFGLALDGQPLPPPPTPEELAAQQGAGAPAGSQGLAPQAQGGPPVTPQDALTKAGQGLVDVFRRKK